MLFCDLRGTGRAADVILKDRYQHVWAFDDKLRQLWTLECTTGHFPFPVDVDGDGKDKLAKSVELLGGTVQTSWPEGTICVLILVVHPGAKHGGSNADSLTAFQLA